MPYRRGVFTTAFATTALALILACAPSTAFGLQVLIGPLKPGAQIPQQATLADVYNAMDLTQASASGQIVGADGSAVSADCAIPSGQTSCTVPLNITASPRPDLFTISGGTANATKTSGSINKVTLNNLTIQAQQPTTIVALYFHWFTGVNTSVLRAYGQAASGSLCRPDANNNCQTAAGDTVRLNSAVIYAKSNANLGDPVGCLNTNLCQVSFLPQSQGTGPYTVLAGGVSNNNYFPESTLPTTTQTAQCTLGNCVSAELIVSALTFTFTTAKDAVIQKATQINVSGPKLGEVVNIIHAEAVEIDIQPIYNPNNNDINLTSNGQKQVALLSQKQGSTVIFDPSTVDLTSVLFAVGDGGGAAPVGPPVSSDLNGDGVLDLTFTFSIPDIGPNAIPPGTCSKTQDLGGVGVGVLTGTADFSSSTSTSAQQKLPRTGVPSPTCTPITTDPDGTKTQTCTVCVLGPGANTMTCTATTTTTSQDLPFSGQQTFTCAPQAGG
jgi:hypothetical protein